MIKNRVIIIIFLIVLCEVLYTAGQYFFKKTVNRLHKPRMSDPKSIWRFFRRTLASPTTWLGLGVMAAGLIVWLAALSEGELSFVYPLGSIQYILVLLTARFFLKEKVDKTRVAGAILVALGILLITIS